jgi:hypothetical protein
MTTSSKAQASMEYLIIFGIAVALITITGAIFFSYVNESKTALDQKQVEKMGTEIVNNIEKIYFLGSGNRVTMKMTFPDNLINFTIHHRKINGEPFEFLNISYYWEDQKVSSIFTPNQLYVRFNCTNCYYDTVRNISYYDASDSSLGAKQIQLTSKGTFVSVDFVK